MQRAFEDAAQQFEGNTREEAEAFFVEFRQQSADIVVGLCKEILDTSSVALALFHALHAVQDVVLREWTTLNMEALLGLREDLLTFVVNAIDRLPFFVINQAVHCVAVFVKRGWLDEGGEDARAPVFQQADTLLSMDVTHQAVGLELLSQICVEFAFSSSGKWVEMGLPWEFHQGCRESFETNELLGVFSMLCQLVISHVSEFDVSRCDAVTRAVSLMLEILSWGFTGSRSKLQRLVGSFDSPEAISLRPGSEWRGVILESGLVNMLFELYGRVRSLDDALSSTVRQCLVRTASLTGSVFSDGNEGGQERSNHVASLLSGAMEAMRNPISAPGTEEDAREGLEICEVIKRLASSFEVKMFPALPCFGEFVQCFARYTVRLLGAAAQEIDSTWYLDAYVHAQSTWVILLAPALSFTPVSVKCPPPGVAADMAALQRAESEVAEQATMMRQHRESYAEVTRPIVEAFVEMTLARGRQALQTGGDDEEEPPLEEHMGGLATIARLDPSHSLSLVCSMLSSTADQLGATSATADLLEDASWLVTIIGFIMADEADGEEVSVPATINQLSAEWPEGESDPVVTCTHCVWRLVEYENALLDSGRAGELSADLGGSLMWFFTRWSSTYLTPRPGLYESIGLPLSAHIAEAYGHPEDCEGGRGLQVVEGLLQKISRNLVMWNGDNELAAKTCGLLVHLSKNPRVASHALSSDGLWTLLRAHVADEGALAGLSPDVKRQLVRGMCSMALGNAGSPGEFLQEVLGSVQSRWQALSIGHSSAQQSLAAVDVGVLVEMHRGIAAARVPGCAELFFSVCASVFDEMVELLRRFVMWPDVVLSILSFFSDVAEHQFSFVSVDSTGMMCSAVLQSLEVFASTRSSVQAQSDEDHADMAEHLCAIIGTLKHVISKDFLDFEEDVFEAEVRVVRDNNDGPDTADVAFHGLSLIIPVITPELLQFPTLCRLFFELTSFMIEIYPEKVMDLPPPLFQSLLKCAEFGIAQANLDIAKLSWEALAAILTHHAEAVHRGGEGLAQQLAAAPGLFAYYLHEVFAAMVFQEFSVDMLDSASKSFFALLCCEEDAYQQMVMQLVEQQNSAEMQQRLAAAFKALLGDNGLRQSFDRPNLTTFRSNLAHFLVCVRSFLRKY